MRKKIAEFGKISKCVLLSFITTIILCGLLAAAVCLWQIDENTARIIIFLVMIVSVLFGAFVLAKNLEHSGLLNGLVMALIYFAVIILMSFILRGRIFVDIRDLTRLITISASGMLGGILGINI